MNKNKKNYVKLELTKEEFQYLKDCMLIFQDALEINKTIDESCMSILLELRKEERKKMSGFVDKIVRWSWQIKTIEESIEE